MLNKASALQILNSGGKERDRKGIGQFNPTEKRTSGPTQCL